MEVSSSVVGGLQLCGDSTRIPDACFQQLVDSVFHNILNPDNQRDVKDFDKNQSVDVAVLKQSYAAVTTVVLEASKRDADSATLSSFLEDNKLSGSRCSTLINFLEKNKLKIRAHLSSIGHTLPHIVDVDWRMDYAVKSDVLEKLDEPTYLFNLKTEQYGQSNTEDVTFSCNVEQLQDLVGKLKDAVKCLEKISQG